MNSVGETLRRERVKQGLDLAEVAARTKISSKFLTAIEEDDRKSLPGSFFYRNFVHQYALALSLNTQQFDAEMDRLLGDEAPPPLPGQDGNPIRAREPEIQVREGLFERRPVLWSLGLLSMVAVGCFGLYVLWNKTLHAKAITSVLPHPAIQARAELTPVPAPSPAPEVRNAKSAGRVSLPAAHPRAPETAPALQPERVVIDFLAKEETWMEVLSDGKRVFSGVLQPNESRSIEGKQMAKLTVGNAAGLEIRLNGRVIGPIGPHGRVRVVVFTGDNFQIVPPDRT